MMLYYSVMLVISVSYYLISSFYAYRLLAKQGVAMNFYLVTTPGYLYYIAHKHDNRTARLLSLGNIGAFMLILVATGKLDA